jgi:AraC family transcriptional regulator
MKPEIKISPEKKLAGIRMMMTFSDNKTGELWRSFMPRRKELLNRVSDDLYSLQVYDPDMDFAKSEVNKPFEKWAAAEVADFNSIPAGMESYILPQGLYAVFQYKGAASSASETFRYIFEKWLPASGYHHDNRPHFEILGEEYKNDDPESEEEIWIPVRPAD